MIGGLGSNQNGQTQRFLFFMIIPPKVQSVVFLPLHHTLKVAVCLAVLVEMCKQVHICFVFHSRVRSRFPYTLENVSRILSSLKMGSILPLLFLLWLKVAAKIVLLHHHLYSFSFIRPKPAKCCSRRGRKEVYIGVLTLSTPSNRRRWAGVPKCKCIVCIIISKRSICVTFPTMNPKLTNITIIV